MSEERADRAAEIVLPAPAVRSKRAGFFSLQRGKPRIHLIAEPQATAVVSAI